MSDAVETDKRVERFAEAVRSFAGVPPRRFASLLPLREGIAELRQKGASFGMIRELLALAGIEVAADTVRRFYRDVIEEPRAASNRSRKRERQAASKPLELPALAMPTSPAVVTTVSPKTPEPPRSRGPRVADPRNL